MDVIHDLIWIRGVERWFLAIGGLGALIAGVVMYKWGIEGALKIDAQHKGTKLHLANAGPGAVLTLAGLAILVTGLVTNLKVDLKGPQGIDPKNENQEIKISYSKKQHDSLDTFLKEFSSAEFEGLLPEVKRNSVLEFQKRAKQQRDDLQKVASLTKPTS
jgi:hypothetical protein